MHSGSDVGSGFGTGSKIKKGKEMSNMRAERPTFWETMLFITLKRQDIEQIFVIEKKTVPDSVWIRTGPKPFRNRERNHNKPLRFKNTVKNFSLIEITYRT